MHGTSYYLVNGGKCLRFQGHVSFTCDSERPCTWAWLQSRRNHTNGTRRKVSALMAPPPLLELPPHIPRLDDQVGSRLHISKTGGRQHQHAAPLPGTRQYVGLQGEMSSTFDSNMLYSSVPGLVLRRDVTTLVVYAIQLSAIAAASAIGTDSACTPPR